MVPRHPETAPVTESEWRAFVDAKHGDDAEFAEWAYSMARRTEHDLETAHRAWRGKGASNPAGRETLDVLSRTVPASESKHPALVAERRRRRL